VSSTPWWRAPARADRWALLWLVAVPSLLFIVPAFFGRPAIDADNLIQNFPLRVLAGHQIASGHLPLLDPLTYAGTPLLGGLNAGALYPLTVIFAFVPAIAAWLINLIAVYVTAALGVFALLRWHGLRTWPSFAAAMTYAYSGAMIGQIVHVGVVQGSSFIPWAVLILLALSRRIGTLDSEASWRQLGRAVVPWVCAEALLWGMVFLSGEPRGIAEIELLSIVLVPCVLLLRTSYWLESWRARALYVATLAAGFAWGVGIGLVQLLPGWSFINYSQRSVENYSFFGAGSLAVHWTALLATPDLFGGNGTLDQRGYFANYNLAEVTGYVGILALVAGAAFLTRCTRRGWRGVERDYAIYVVVGVIGLFATWGSFTPLGHVFRAIPLFGVTRLQSRNIILVDFALAVVLGWWLQQVHDGSVRAGLARGARWVTSLPALLVAALSVALIGWGPWVIDRVNISNGKSYLETGLKFVNAVHLVIALGAAVVLLVLRDGRRRFRWLMVVLVVDVVVFLVFTSTGLIGGSGPSEPSRGAAVALLGTKGRFALVDTGGEHTGIYRALGEPNMNVFTELPSVQGYGSLISTIYDQATGTHPMAFLNVCNLAKGNFRQLRLSAVAIAGALLATKVAESPSVTSSCVKLTRVSSTRRYFGQVLTLRDVILTGGDGRVLSASPLALELLRANGRPEGSWLSPTEASSNKAVYAFNQSTTAAGFVVKSSTGVRIASAVVASYGRPTYQLNTSFQLAIDQRTWHLTYTRYDFAVFRATKLLPPAWLTSPSYGRVTKIRTASWGDTWVTVKLAKESTLKRSEAYLPGWRATAVNDVNGRAVSLTIHRAGLIEKVRVPAGEWTIHFHYRAPYIEVSTTVSAVSGALFLGVVAILADQERRRRRGKVVS